MPRSMDGSVITASSDSVVRCIIMVDLDFESGHIYAHTGVGSLVWNGKTFLGVGGLGEISAIEETSDLQASGINLGLSGIDPSNISVALNEHYQGRTAIIYQAFLDTNYALIGDPVVIFSGRMDSQSIVLGKEGKITLKIENPLADWDRPRIRRYNNDDQRSYYPNDKGFEFVEQAVQKEITWGA